MRENIDDIVKNLNGISSWSPVELTVNNIQKDNVQPELKNENTPEEKSDMEMSLKFMRYKEKTERKRLNKYILIGILIVVITVIIILII